MRMGIDFYLKDNVDEFLDKIVQVAEFWWEKEDIIRDDITAVIVFFWNELYTYISFDIDEVSPVCVEHLFSIVQDGKIKVSFDSENNASFLVLINSGKK